MLADNQLHQFDRSVFFAQAAHIVDQRMPFTLEEQLHQADFRVLFRVKLGLQRRRAVARRHNLFDDRHALPLIGLHVYNTAGLARALACGHTQTNRLALRARNRGHGQTCHRAFQLLARAGANRGEFRFIRLSGPHVFGQRHARSGFVLPADMRFVEFQPIPRLARQAVDGHELILAHLLSPPQPMLPFISRRIRLFISTAYSSGSSLDTLSAKPLTIYARASSSLIPRLIR